MNHKKMNLTINSNSFPLIKLPQNENSSQLSLSQSKREEILQQINCLHEVLDKFTKTFSEKAKAYQPNELWIEEWLNNSNATE